ncbi:MAG: glucose-1-phosphate adenylyltransferase, partial [Candidatus Eisenbacteria bacterium]
MALVLSGGGGERLSVLSAERAVSAVPFGGKYGIIDFVLSNCCHSGIERVGLVTQH